MSEVKLTAVGRDWNQGVEGIAAVRWLDGQKTFTAWLNVGERDSWLALLPRVFDWACSAISDLRRRDGEKFYNAYFLNRAEILISGKPLTRRVLEPSPFADDEEDEDDLGVSSINGPPIVTGYFPPDPA